jgi:hypothetical protein
MKNIGKQVLFFILVLSAFFQGCTKQETSVPVTVIESVPVPFTVIESWNDGAGLVITIKPENVNQEFLAKLEKYLPTELKYRTSKPVITVAVLDDEKAARMYRKTDFTPEEDKYVMKHLIALYTNNKNTAFEEFKLMKEIIQK